METLLDSGKYSDLTLRCAEKTWKVRRAVLCTSSSVFAAMVDGSFKEAQTREIDLPDDKPEIVGKMLRFLYRRDYDDERDELDADEPILMGGMPRPIIPNGYYAPAASSWDHIHARQGPSEVAQTPRWSEKSLLINAQVYIIGDKYDIKDLKECSMRKYAEVVEHLWDTPNFPTSAKLLYDNTPQRDRLPRNIIAGTARANIFTLIDLKDFEDVIVSHGDLAVNVLKSVVKWVLQREEQRREPKSVLPREEQRWEPKPIFHYGYEGSTGTENKASWW